MIPTDILNYRILRLLGSGGMGSVYLAANTNIDQQVAIKALRPEMAKNPALRARFKQEAELLCSIDHPGIVKFLNYVETPDGVFLIMEYVKGITLEDFISKKNGLIVEKKAYPILCEILDAFEYAHSKGIIHRDIKPSNIIIQEDGHIKIMDFGIAQIVSESQSDSKQSIMGTPAFMSPEQIYGKNIDTRSDIYSLGVLIHHMLTGKAPYDSTKLTEQEIKRRIVKETMPRMNEYYPYISDKIQQVVDKATEKIPEARYQSCQEMKKAVKKALAPDPIPKSILYGGIAFLLACVIGGFFIWDHYRTKISYYEDYVEVYGIPKGIGSLSENDMRHREASYRFEYSKGKLRRVSYVNSKGNLVNHHSSEDIDRIVDMTLTYAEGSGKVDTEKFKNRSGRVLYVKDFDSNLKTCTFKLDDELGTEMTLNSQVGIFESAYDNNQKGRSKISKNILHFNDKGFLEKVEYAGFGNIRVHDGQGIFGLEYKYDEDGRVVEKIFLGKDGSPKSTKLGMGKVKYTYDDNGRCITNEYQTLDGKPSHDGNNCPVVTMTYDKWGNKTSEKYSNVDGRPVVRKDNLTAGAIFDYNDEGECVKVQFIGIDGSPAYTQGVNGYIDEYDENGYRSKRSFIDANGEAAIVDSGDGLPYFQSVSKNDIHGNELEVTLLNMDGQLVDTPYFSRKACSYDSVGNLLSEYYLNENGEPASSPKFGYAGIELEYNEQGRLSRATYMGPDKKRITLPDVHYCYITKEYDVRGNLSKMAYFDDKGNPVMTDEGIATVEIEYDDNGNETARSFFNTKGKPCVLNNYFARIEKGYDEQGNIVSESYKNTDGKPMSVNGRASINWEYNSRGNITKERPSGINGNLPPEEYETSYKYDPNDNIVEIAFYSDNKEPVECEEGYHKKKMEYNSTNYCVKTEYFGKNNTLKNLEGQNYAVEKMEYDDRGNKTSQTFFRQDGQRGSDYLKVHKYFNQYDRIANKINHQISFGTDGKPIIANDIAAEGRLEYDKRGNLIRTLCFDGYGKKINCRSGWHEIRNTYDDSGEKTSEAYFSIDGKPATEKNANFHKAVLRYNPMRLVESVSFFDTSGKPTLYNQSHSIVKYKYNNQNQRTETSYFGTDGRPIDSKDGWHREVYSFKAGTAYKCQLYDKTNRKIGEATKVNNKWDVKGVGTSSTTSESGWKQKWEAMKSLCPYHLSDEITFKNITISNDAVTVDIDISTKSMQAMADNLGNLTLELEKYLRQQTETPSFVDIKVNLNEDNNNNIIIN